MPQPAALTTAGMFLRDANRTAVPLTGVAIDAEISGLCAGVSIAHRYVNHEATPVEAVYVFPMDEGAAVCGFEAVVGGTLVVGEVQERGKAFEACDDAIEQGRSRRTASRRSSWPPLDSDPAPPAMPVPQRPQIRRDPFRRDAHTLITRPDELDLSDPERLPR